MAFLSCVLVLTPKAEAVTTVHTDVDTPNAATVVTAVARVAAEDLWRDTLLWSNTVYWNQTAKRAETRAALVARANKAGEATAQPKRGAPAVSAPISGDCGGNLPSCCILRRESGGNIRAQNPVSSASGKWQFLDSTWAGYGGYQHAKDAPAGVQDERARIVYAGGAGAGHWAGNGC